MGFLPITAEVDPIVQSDDSYWEIQRAALARIEGAEKHLERIEAKIDLILNLLKRSE
jgi:hypothetical protein